MGLSDLRRANKHIVCKVESASFNLNCDAFSDDNYRDIQFILPLESINVTEGLMRGDELRSDVDIVAGDEYRIACNASWSAAKVSDFRGQWSLKLEHVEIGQRHIQITQKLIINLISDDGVIVRAILFTLSGKLKFKPLLWVASKLSSERSYTVIRVKEVPDGIFAELTLGA
ncbi:hypothetical protein [Roseovarius arcticus]|uniref:hypothetical protein n=1 Tax=Roseovarius arcticus TaxID=2547404 RepID=UPI001110A9FC|nr:hypothetical protein [Roseovarius arcticus]